VSTSFVCCTCKAGHRYPPPLVTASPPRVADVLARHWPQETTTRQRLPVAKWWESGSVQLMSKMLLVISAVPNAASGRRDAHDAEHRKVGRPCICCWTIEACWLTGPKRRSCSHGHSPPLLRYRLGYAAQPLRWWGARGVRNRL